jgi:hypothetical protein
MDPKHTKEQFDTLKDRIIESALVRLLSKVTGSGSLAATETSILITLQTVCADLNHY